ncbi:MAG: glycosyltransferase family 39 protein [Oscillospiraceae bacterium]|jgi:biotin carboxyl carrier protein|nr:glycosyltransferase family 39 protein [Oscillospiraceae bacterium]
MGGFLTGLIPRLVPVPFIAFIAIFFVMYLYSQRPAKGSMEWVGFALRRGKTADFEKHPMGRRDWVWMAGITVIYALIAFFYLGDTNTPTTFYRYEHDGSALEFTLDEGVTLSRLQYYNGLNVNNHAGKVLRFELSADGETWDKQADLSRDTSGTFRWHEADLKSYGMPVKALRFMTDGTGLDIGEIVLRDENDAPVDPSRITVSRPDAAALFDEQSSAPLRRTVLNGTHFDEIYHAYTAYEFTKGLYPYENTHPPLGKLTTMVGIKMFGMTPFGWRFMPTLFGVLMLPFLFVLIQNMFGKTVVSVCGTLIFAFDFMHFVQTRISTIDVYAEFYIILMYFFMYRWLVSEKETRFFRALPNLALCGIAFGLGAASKWTSIYAGFGLIALYVWAFIRRRKFYLREKIDLSRFWGFFAATIASSVLFFVVIPCGTYLASYIPYDMNETVTFDGVLDAAWSNQKTMFNYHSDSVLDRSELIAPADGKVTQILKKPREDIKAGDVVLVMTGADGQTINVTAEKESSIQRVLKGEGKTVKKGETLLLLTGKQHPYASRWYEWLVDKKPVYYFAGDYASDREETIKAPASGVVTEFVSGATLRRGETWVTIQTDDGKTAEFVGSKEMRLRGYAANVGDRVEKGDAVLLASTYLRVSVSTFNNPVVVWAGLAALVALALMLVFRGKLITLFILIGYFSQLAPWFTIDRTTYAYHYFPSLIFIVLALCFMFSTWLDRDAESAAHIGAPVKTGFRMTVAFTAVAVALFAMFYPVLAGYPVSYTYVSDFLKWIPGWPV